MRLLSADAVRNKNKGAAVHVLIQYTLVLYGQATHESSQVHRPVRREGPSGDGPTVD
jgi:hypothetical protein